YDYRYFLEPDLVPVVPDPAWITAVGASLGPLPGERRARLATLVAGALPAGAGGSPDPGVGADLEGAPGVSDADQEQISTVVDLGLDGLVTAAVEGGIPARLALARTANEAATDAAAAAGLDPRAYTSLLAMEVAGSLSATQVKAVLHDLLAGGGDPAELARARGFEAMADGALVAVVQEAVDSHPAEWDRYRGGEEKLAQFFVGQVMKATRGQANGKAVVAELERLAAR
ncbi:MAG: Asp-tRNA(Asn)/Glu-tRNA(Gln) amidotransferase subunit GatB, partial [Acidimicrobiales bacterium]